MDERQKRRMLAWGKNVLIVLLTCSALYLLGRSTLYEGLGQVMAGNREERSQTESLLQEEQIYLQPVRLVLQNAEGRYGVQYDQETVQELFRKSQIGSALWDALADASPGHVVPESQWQAVLRGPSNWIYYDFLGNIPLSRLPVWLRDGVENPSLPETARRFLLTETENGHMLYFRNETTGLYYACPVAKEREFTLSAAVDGYSPNGAIFAFEQPETYGGVAPYVLILPTSPQLSTYEVSNPLLNLDEEAQEELLKQLEFNPQATATYQTANGWKVREGEDTLRIQEGGTLSFHSATVEQPRYPAEGKEVGDRIERAYRILASVLKDRCGEVQVTFLNAEPLEDGGEVLTFAYLLDGAQVQLYQQGYGAKFVFREGCVTDFTIHVRHYQKGEGQSLVLPERQAIAAMSALEQTEKELLLCFLDNGDPHLSATWVAQ